MYLIILKHIRVCNIDSLYCTSLYFWGKLNPLIESRWWFLTDFCSFSLTDVKDIQGVDLQETYIGLYDPHRFHDNNLNTIERLPYWWGYFCDNRRKYHKGEVHCLGIDMDADRRFALKNNVFYSVDEVPECTQEASEIQCGTYDECSEVKNDSTICITDGK